jgi:Zn finger protein HypA/HybF involved in hydrogenase expression
VQEINCIPLTFTCPGCKEKFEFDRVGEYQLVPCPVCGIDLITIKKERKLQLQPFEFDTSGSALLVELTEVTTVES